jgi:tetratricopeptide (TPR) repeat protein
LPGSSAAHKVAAAYGLCGVYQKLDRVQEQLRFALWLYTANKKNDEYQTNPAQLFDQSLYWAASGWDLNLLLENEASLDELQAFVAVNPNLPDLRIVNYSIAVRLARENRYDEAAEVYQSIHAIVRAPRMRQLASLYKEANRSDLADVPRQQAQYKLAEFLAANPNRVYFNDALWGGYQRYALIASTDSRLTGEERRVMMEGERKLKDDQEERWRAYLILREIVQRQGKAELGRKSAVLALQCLSGISDRFGRLDEIRSGYAELSKLLRP